MCGALLSISLKLFVWLFVRCLLIKFAADARAKNDRTHLVFQIQYMSIKIQLQYNINNFHYFLKKINLPRLVTVRETGLGLFFTLLGLNFLLFSLLTAIATLFIIFCGPTWLFIKAAATLK